MIAEQLMEYESDERYIYYRPIGSMELLNCFIDTDVIEDCQINISKDHGLEELLPIISDYLDWLNNCSQELTEYFQKKIGEKVSEDWFSSIEIFNFSITFNSDVDFGATISCGESIFSDHIIEFDFDRFEIIDDRLVG